MKHRIPIIALTLLMTSCLPAEPTTKPATQPGEGQRSSGWSKPVNGLRARIVAGRYLTKRLGMEVSVSVQNVGKTPIVINLGKIAFMDWRVLDAENRLVRPGSGRLIKRMRNWQSVIPGQEIGTIISRSKVSRDGVLDMGTRIWNLKPGKYKLKCDLVVHPNIKRLKASAWSGKIKLPPVEFEVIAEVSDEHLKTAVAKVRAAHPAKGKAMWQTLANLVNPGMTVRQMKIALPPARPVPGKISPGFISWDGTFFFMRYQLDKMFYMEASGFGIGKGSDEMVLTSRPRVKRLELGPIITIQPAATKPTSKPASRPTTTTSAPAVDPAVMAILKRLEAAGEKYPNITANIDYKVDMLQTGDTESRTGRVYYQGPGEKESAKFRIHFDTLRQGTGPKIKDVVDYAFDGAWLTVRKERIKQMSRYQVARPGEKVNPLQLGKGPFPVPFGQKADIVIKHFHATTRPTRNTGVSSPGDVPPVKDMAETSMPRSTGVSPVKKHGRDGHGTLKTDPKDTDYIKLTTRRRYRKEFSVVWLEMWISRKTSLPVKIVAEDRSENQTTVIFKDTKTPKSFDKKTFTLPRPPAGWEYHVERFKGQVK